VIAPACCVIGGLPFGAGPSCFCSPRGERSHGAPRTGVIYEPWPAADHLAARFGPAAGLLPCGIATLLLAAPVAWVIFSGRRPDRHDQQTWKYTHHRAGT
jgi:hypothetical protein